MICHKWCSTQSILDKLQFSFIFKLGYYNLSHSDLVRIEGSCKMQNIVVVKNKSLGILLPTNELSILFHWSIICLYTSTSLSSLVFLAVLSRLICRFNLTQSEALHSRHFVTYLFQISLLIKGTALFETQWLLCFFRNMAMSLFSFACGQEAVVKILNISLKAIAIPFRFSERCQVETF